MHDTSYDLGRRFLRAYVVRPASVIIELGAADLNGSLRPHMPPDAFYLALDIAASPGVDLVVAPGKPLPLTDGVADIVISTSQFEHDDFFWVTYLECLRLLKPSGVFYLYAPSNGWYHRYPNDNWRFYPDAGHALVRWGRANGYEASLVESFVRPRHGDVWNDFCAVFARAPFDMDTQRLLCDEVDGWNVWRPGAIAAANEEPASEDMKIIAALRAENAALADRLAALAPGPAGEGPRAALTGGHT